MLGSTVKVNDSGTPHGTQRGLQLPPINIRGYTCSSICLKQETKKKKKNEVINNSITARLFSSRVLAKTSHEGRFGIGKIL